MEESELVLDEVGMPRSCSTVLAAAAAAVPVSHESGFVTILRTLPRRAMGEAATRRGEKAERAFPAATAGLAGGASVLADGVEGCAGEKSESAAAAAAAWREELDPEAMTMDEGRE
jgi:hypothetical protein